MQVVDGRQVDGDVLVCLEWILPPITKALAPVLSSAGCSANENGNDRTKPLWRSPGAAHTRAPPAAHISRAHMQAAGPFEAEPFRTRKQTNSRVGRRSVRALVEQRSGRPRIVMRPHARTSTAEEDAEGSLLGEHASRVKVTGAAPRLDQAWLAASMLAQRSVEHMQHGPARCCSRMGEVRIQCDDAGVVGLTALRWRTG